MTQDVLLRDAYRELDEASSLSRSTTAALERAGFDVGVILAAQQAHEETQEETEED